MREKGWDEGCSAKGGKICLTPHPNPSPARGEGLQAIAFITYRTEIAGRFRDKRDLR
ncbi:hypothetical protein [Azospirillum doebereinerae]